MVKELLRITNKTTRENFLNNYALQQFLNGEYHLIYKTGKRVVICPYGICNKEKCKCEECWKNAINQIKFKNEKVY